MKKRIRIVTVIIATLAVAMIPTIKNNLDASSEAYGPYGAFSVFVKNDYTMTSGSVEGRIAVANDLVLDENARIATGYNAETVIGYFLENTEYPSIVNAGSIQMHGNAEVVDGNVTTTDITDEQLLKLEGATSGIVVDTRENLTKAFEYFNKQADHIISDLASVVPDLNDPSLSQPGKTYYDQKDKSLIISEMAPTDSEKNVLAIDKIEIGTLQSYEKLIISSDAETINIDEAAVYYQGALIEVDKLDNLDQNVESLANNVVWFFPNAKQVTINKSEVIGSIYAPLADMELNKSALAGQLLVNNLKQTDSKVINRVSFVNDYEFGRKINNVELTIEYLDESSEPISEPQIYTREVGTTFITSVPKIDGYQVIVDSTLDSLEGGMSVPEKSTKYTVHYEQTGDAELTVSHELRDGTPIAEAESEFLNVGDEYEVKPLEKSEYSLIEEPKNARGTIKSNTAVTFIYAPRTAVSTITVEHVNSSGVQLAASTSFTVETGTNYDATSHIISSRVYKLDGLYTGSASLTGVADGDKKVMLQYSASSTCSQYGNAVSGANANINYSIASKNRPTKNELEFNEVKSTGLVEQQAVVNSPAGKLDLGVGYSLTSTNPSFMDYKYSFNGASNYEQYLPIRQTGGYEPINVTISNDGNNYDLRSRNDTSSIATYASNGINYQKIIASRSFKSLNIQFGECQAAVSFNNGSTTTNGTNIMNFAYTDFPEIDETFAGYTFDWNASTKKLTVNIIFEKNGALQYSGNTFTVDLSSYSFLPQDFAVSYQNTASSKTTLYRPYTASNRHYYNVVAMQSPFVDPTSTRYTLSDAMAKNEIYEIYALNGKVQKTTQLTSSSYIKSYSLPYNPKGYTSMITSSFPRSDSNLYAYLAGKSYTVSSGFALGAETPVIYGKNKHPRYSATVNNSDVTLYEGDYATLADVAIPLKTSVFRDGELITTGDTISNASHVIVNESAVNFAAKGTYSAFGFVKTRDETSGEYVNSKSNITVTIASAILDYGDAPSTYGEAGAKVGSSSYRYNIGINRNGNRATHADAESSPQYSSDARGDDTKGMTDETGWFNMDTNGIGKLNVEMEKLRISFPYTATGTGAVAFWIDYNENGVFESFEGQVQNINASAYDSYGMVNFDIDLTKSFSTLEAGDKTFARVRILSDKSSLTTSASSTTFDKYYGETEDFIVNLYGKKNEYQICTQVLANTPTVTVKNVAKVTKAGPNNDESGIKYTFDIGEANPNSNSSNSFYPDVQVTVTSKQGIVSNTKSGEPAFFRVEQSTSPYEKPANTINIVSRNKNGDPINLPFTFSFWDLDDFTGSNVIESVSIDKNGVYTEGLDASDIKLTSDTVGVAEDYGTYLKLFTTKQVESEPEAMFLLQGTSLAKSDIKIVEEARLLEIGMGLDLGQMNKVIEECVAPYQPKAQIQIFENFYDNEVSIYNNYPFAYQSTNIPFPYFPNFNSVTQNLYIPHGVEFVDGNTDVTIYRRNFLGKRTEADWQKVDKSLYTQKLDTVNNISSVTFKDPVANNIYGYEYRMEYNFEISEDMATGQRIVFKSDFEYNKGKTGEYTETYKLNDVTAIVKEAFTADVNTVMGTDTVDVVSDSSSIYYTYKYLNCDTCQGVSDKTSFNGGIEIPIPEEEQMNFYSDKDFDRYEDILLTLYDNDMKVFEIPIRRWYPTKTEQQIDDTTDLTQIADDLNPIGQTVQIRAAYTRFRDFKEPVKIRYTQETINVQQEASINKVENSILRVDNINATISTEPMNSVPKSWQPTYWGPITVDDLVSIYDADKVFIPVEEKLCTGEEENGEESETECIEPGYHLINIEAAALDSTLETSKVTIDNKDYKSIYFKDAYKLDDDKQINLESKLDNRYIIENFSGRIYNSKIDSECLLQKDAPEDYTGMYCYGDEKKLYNRPTDEIEKILQGYNDVADSDVKVNTVLKGGIPLSSELEVGDKYDYYLYLADFGLNQTSVTIADKLEIKSTPIGYYQNESEYFFKRETPTEEEIECIKTNTCGTEYEVVISGEISNPLEIQNEISKDPTLLDSFKSFNKWLDKYL